MDANIKTSIHEEQKQTKENSKKMKQGQVEGVLRKVNWVSANIKTPPGATKSIVKVKKQQTKVEKDELNGFYSM